MLAVPDRTRGTSLARRCASVIAGLLIAFAIVSAFDALAAALFAMPDVESADHATLAAVIAAIPAAAMAIIATGWFVAPLGGAWFALRIADWPAGGWAVTILFLTAGLYNQVVLPHPAWMQGCALALPLLGGWLAGRLHRKPYPGEPLLG